MVSSSHSALNQGVPVGGPSQSARGAGRTPTASGSGAADSTIAATDRSARASASPGEGSEAGTPLSMSWCPKSFALRQIADRPRSTACNAVSAWASGGATSRTLRTIKVVITSPRRTSSRASVFASMSMRSLLAWPSRLTSFAAASRPPGKVRFSGLRPSSTADLRRLRLATIRALLNTRGSTLAQAKKPTTPPAVTPPTRHPRSPARRRGGRARSRRSAPQRPSPRTSTRPSTAAPTPPPTPVRRASRSHRHLACPTPKKR